MRMHEARRHLTHNQHECVFVSHAAPYMLVTWLLCTRIHAFLNRYPGVNTPCPTFMRAFSRLQQVCALYYGCNKSLIVAAGQTIGVGQLVCGPVVALVPTHIFQVTVGRRRLQVLAHERAAVPNVGCPRACVR
jgi:hypothetical protein